MLIKCKDNVFIRIVGLLSWCCVEVHFGQNHSTGRHREWSIFPDEMGVFCTLAKLKRDSLSTSRAMSANEACQVNKRAVPSFSSMPVKFVAVTK